MAAALAVHAGALFVLLIVPARPAPHIEWVRARPLPRAEELRYVATPPQSPAPDARSRGLPRARPAPAPPGRLAVPLPQAASAAQLTAPPSIVSPAPGTGPADTGGAPPGAGGATGNGGGEGTGGAGGAGGAVPIKHGAQIANNLLIGVDAPAGVRPFQLKVVFEVDSLGRARILSATRTRDGGYNRTLMAELGQIRFHPATRADGTAVTDTVPLEWDF